MSAEGLDEAHSNGHIRGLVWCGHVAYGLLAAFCIVIGVAELLGIVNSAPEGDDGMLRGLPLLVLGTVGLWYSVWCIARHAKHRPATHGAGEPGRSSR